MRDSWLKKLGTIAISLLLLAYVGYQIYKSVFSGVTTETAVMFQAADTINTSGFAIRQEAAITSANGNAVQFLYRNGEKIAKGGVLAQVYAKMDDVSAQEEIDLLDEEIMQLERLNKLGNGYETNQEDIDGKINEQFFQTLNAINTNQLATFQSTRNALLDLMNERQIVTGAISDFNQQIEILKQRRQTLQSSHGQAIATITAPTSGYFIRELDGYENAFDITKLGEITTEELQNFEARQQALPENAICKISAVHEWYIACVVSSSDALKLEKGASMRLLLPSVSTTSLPVTVREINQPDKKADAVVVFQSDVLDGTLISVRHTPVQILTKQYSGIKISRSAIRMETLTREIKDEDGNVTGTEEKEVQGVYILYGEEIRFREISPLYMDNHYVICDPNPADSFSGKNLRLYDEVVVSGKDLYDGKYIK